MKKNYFQIYQGRMRMN